jgi:hypothetical protein
MRSAYLLFLLIAFWFVRAAALGGEPSVEALLKLHSDEARAYRMYRDEAQSEPLNLQAEPVFTWTNLVDEDTQYGHIYVWTWLGRPEAIGTMFSTRTRDGKQRKLIHEFHTLSTRRLFPVTPESSEYQWTPRQGIAMERLQDAPVAAETAPARLRQMRTLARTFSVETVNPEGQRFELRLLPTPVVRYEAGTGDVVDGALFVLVMSVGTDPEALLLVEARRSADNMEPAWHAAAVRFSDRDVIVKRGSRVVWSSQQDPSRKVVVKDDWRLLETPDRTYMCYQARVVEELGDATK